MNASNTNLLELLKTWGGPKDAFEVIQAREQNPEQWTADLRVTAAPSFTVSVQKNSNEPHLLVTHRMEIPQEVVRLVAGNQDLTEDVRSIVSIVEELRAGTVTCALLGDGAGSAVEIHIIIYQDGFSRHTLNAAALEAGKARRALATRFKALVESAHTLAQIQQQLEAEQKHHEQLMAQTKAKASPPVSTERLCPKCGRPVPVGKKFCVHDGTPVP